MFFEIILNLCYGKNNINVNSNHLKFYIYMKTNNFEKRPNYSKTLPRILNDFKI